MRRPHLCMRWLLVISHSLSLGIVGIGGAQAKEDVKRALAALNEHLLKKTFLVGEAITAADVVVACSLLNAFKLVRRAPAYAACASSATSEGARVRVCGAPRVWGAHVCVCSCVCSCVCVDALGGSDAEARGRLACGLSLIHI